MLAHASVQIMIIFYEKEPILNYFDIKLEAEFRFWNISKCSQSNIKIFRVPSTPNWTKLFNISKFKLNSRKVERVFPMVISSDYRMGQHRDADHQEDAIDLPTENANKYKRRIFSRKKIYFCTALEYKK